MKFFKSSDLKNNYEITFNQPYNYNDVKYKINCLLKSSSTSLFKNVIIKTPKLHLQSNLNSGYIVISSNNIINKHLVFINFIKDLEKQAGNFIKLKLKKNVNYIVVL